MIWSTFTFLIQNFSFDKDFIIFGVGNSFSTHADNCKKDILLVGEGLKQGLGNISITSDVKYYISVTESKEIFV